MTTPSFLFGYSLRPIDDWAGWLTESQFREQECRWTEYETLRTRALSLAMNRLGWEGDFGWYREPFVSGLPSAQAVSQLMVGWKQGNDGTTFVVAPVGLRWLDYGADKRVLEIYEGNRIHCVSMPAGEPTDYFLTTSERAGMW